MCVCVCVLRICACVVFARGRTQCGAAHALLPAQHPHTSTRTHTHIHTRAQKHRVGALQAPPARDGPAGGAVVEGQVCLCRRHEVCVSFEMLAGAVRVSERLTRRACCARGVAVRVIVLLSSRHWAFCMVWLLSSRHWALCMFGCFPLVIGRCVRFGCFPDVVLCALRPVACLSCRKTLSSRQFRARWALFSHGGTRSVGP